MKTEMRYETKLTLILGATFGFVFFDRNALNFLMPFIQAEMHFSNAEVGMLAGVLSLSWAVSGMLMGRLSDVSGKRKQILLLAVLVFSLMSFSTGLARSFETLLIARLVMGLSEGGVLPISQTLIADASSPERRGLNMGLMQNVLSNLMGSLFAPLILVALANWSGWRSAFYLTLVPGLILCGLILAAVKNQASNPVSIQSVHSDKRETPMTRSRFAAAITNRGVALCMLIGSLMVAWMICGWVFLPLYFVNVAKLTSTQMSLVMSALGVSGAIAGFLVPALSDRFGRRPVLVLFCLLGILAPLAALFLAHNVPLLLVLLPLGWMAAGTFSIFMATVPCESVEGSAGITATAMGLVMGSSELFGGFLAPLVMGHAADTYGLAAPLAVEAVFAGIAGVVCLFVRETAPAKLGNRQLRGATANNAA